MNLYLAGEHTIKNTLAITEIGGGHTILESFYYIRNNQWFPQILPFFDGFLLDSGAFTYMQGNGAKCDWDKYIEDYADWINRFDIKLFFELDIDSIVGLPRVEQLRERLEALTGKKPIPVWHGNRGLDYFKWMCDAYPYVALGGIAIKEIKHQDYHKIFPWFITEAHNRGVKIHGLGYTNIEGLHTYHFDSVDSTAWLYGNRGGYVMIFDENTGYFIKKQAPEGYRLKSTQAAIFNYKQWQKFQAYAVKYL